MVSFPFLSLLQFLPISSIVYVVELFSGFGAVFVGVSSDQANSVRLRLLWLSEAAKKLKRQAAVNLHTDMENDSRELLF
ncbi:hypothetical protein Ddye_005049 [Dipteronia dyeriana]|uniref:Uncharacterized protein n=1 Tax=Dipteronia dyeriana TaxID=168575 RepID=A0AAD9XFD8_9ROSI|nr:hypothetical protein Ddye_005049 [Dipteronia dyeriana]